MANSEAWREGGLVTDSPEDLSFIDDIVNIARSQEVEEIRSVTSLEDFTTARYKNNWDDLDELCTELSARSALDKTADSLTEEAVEGRDLNLATDTETDICENDSLESELFNTNSNNNNNNIHNNNLTAELVPPPRKKKLAKLKAASDNREHFRINNTHQTTTDDVYSEQVNNYPVERECEISQNNYRGDVSTRDRWASTDLVRECPDTGSHSSASFGSDPEYGDLSEDEMKSTNEKLARNKATVDRRTERNENRPTEGIQDCDYLANDVRGEVKNRGSGSETCNTGFLVEREANEFVAWRDDVAVSAPVRGGPVRVRREDSPDSEADDPPYGSDSDRQYNRYKDNTDPTISQDDHRFRYQISLTPSQAGNSKESSDDEHSRELSASDGLETDDEKNPVKTDSDYSEDINRDPRKTHSIYIDSSDLQNVDETLLVRPAVRRLSAGYEPPSDSEKQEDSPDSKRLRRHSAAAFTHLAAEVPPRPPPRNTKASRGRSKSVTDLSTSAEGETIRRNRSISNRVFSAVGKLSLRVRHAFKPKPVDIFEDAGDRDNGSVSPTSFQDVPADSSREEKLHRSQLYIEIGDDYSTMAKPVYHSQPSDVETVHSYPEMANPPKPRGRLSSLFGLGGKKWHTISALPKLLHLKRKPKDKYAKGDKTSSVSESENMSVASAPIPQGRNKYAAPNGRYAANAKDRIAKDRVKRYDADSKIDLPTFISLDEYRRRMEEAEYLRKMELEELERRQSGIGNRARSMPYLDTSEEEEQGMFNTMRPDHNRTERRRNRPQSHDEIRYRNEKDRRRISEPVDKNDKRRRYKRRDKNERSFSTDSPFEVIDKSTMKVDYGYDIYHFKGHANLRRPQSTSDLTYDSMGDARDPRYSSQSRTRNSVADPEDRGRRRPLQPRDRNSIAVINGGHDKWKKERLPRPKSMSSLPHGDSLSSENDESATVRRRKKHTQKQKAPAPPTRRRDPSPEVDELEDAIQKHLKHERGPLARRKIERKRSQESGSMRRLKESFMAKRIWESVYDQLLKDLSPKRSGATVPPQKAVKTRQDPDEKSSSSRTDDGYYSRCSSHSSRDESDSKGFSRSTSVDEDRSLTKSHPSRSKRLPRSESCRTTENHYRLTTKVDDSDDDFDTKSVAYEPMSLTLGRPGRDRRVWRPTQK